MITLKVGILAGFYFVVVVEKVKSLNVLQPLPPNSSVLRAQIVQF